MKKIRYGGRLLALLMLVFMVSLVISSCGVTLAFRTQEPESTPAQVDLQTQSPVITDAPTAASTTAPTQTPTQTPDPTPPPTPEPVILFVPDADSGFYDEFFDDAVFVGDSITQGLQTFVIYERSHGRPALGEARFLSVAKYSLKDASRDFSPDETNLMYQGVAMSLADCLAAMEAQEVYIMLGVNDWAGSAIDKNIGRYENAIERILERNPDISIFIELCTPVTKNGEKPALNNENMDAFNLRLIKMAKDLGIGYVDVNSPLKDDENYLIAELSRDDYVHLKNEGLRVWIDTLYEHARDCYIAGEWTSQTNNPEDFVGIYMTEEEAADYVSALREAEALLLADFGETE